MVGLCATFQRHRQMMHSAEAHHSGGQLQKTSRVTVWRRFVPQQEIECSWTIWPLSFHQDSVRYVLHYFLCQTPCDWYLLQLWFCLIVDIYRYQYIDPWHGLLQGWAVATLGYLSNKCPTTVDVPMTRSPFVTSQTAFRANLHHGITDIIHC